MSNEPPVNFDGRDYADAERPAHAGNDPLANLRISVNDAALNHIKAAIEATAVPGRVWERSLFEFCRRIKPVCDAYHIEPQNIAALEPAVEAWRAIAKLTDVTFLTVWACFIDSLPKVDESKARFDKAVATVDARPPIGEFPDDPAADRLLAVCAALAAEHFPAPFFLSARRAGEVANTNRVYAAQWLRVLRSKRWIEVAQAHTTTRATRYRMIRWPDGYSPAMDNARQHKPCVTA